MSIGSILIVDDDETDLFICSYTIRRFDPAIAISHAFNGREALDLLARERPDAIILDINMPIMNGFEFLEAYSRDHDRHAPVVAMLTSSHLSADRQKALQYQFVKSYFEKPLTAENLRVLAGIVEVEG